MTIEELIPLLLAPLVGTRCYWDTTPAGGPPKDASGAYQNFCIVQISGGVDKNYLDQTMPDHENYRIEVKSFTNSSLTVGTFAKAVRDAILAANYPVELMGSPISIYDPEQVIRGRLQYFSIWFKP